MTSLRRWLRLLFLILPVVAAGCGVKLVDLGPKPMLFDIEPAPSFPADMTKVDWQLVVDEPSASAMLDTDRMLVRSGGYEVKYFAGARWSDRAPSLVQAQLVKAFDSSGAIVGVSRQSIGLRADYELQGDLDAFDTILPPGAPPTTRISLTLKIVRLPYATIVASRKFTAEEQAGDTSLTAISASFQKALGKILSDAVPWTLSEGQDDYKGREARAHKTTLRGGDAAAGQ